MRDFDLIPFDEGTEVMAAPAIVAALEPRNSKSKAKKSRREKVSTVPKVEKVAVAALSPLQEAESQKSAIGFWLLIALASALVIAQVI